MQYEKQSILTDDENPNGGTDREVDPFMVAKPVLHWNDGEGHYGHTSNSLCPAYSADSAYAESKGRCWLLSWAWCPAVGYTASGYGSELIPFEHGVRILIEQDVYSFPEPQTDRAMSPEEAKLREKLATFLEADLFDDEEAHLDEDEIHQTALRLIADGLAVDPADLAREALKTCDLDFERWCA